MRGAAQRGAQHENQKTPGIESTPAEEVTRDQAFERTRAFGSYLIPGAARSTLPDTVTPPNVLRLVFSRALGVSLPPVPDSSYYATLSRPFHFFNVTDVLNARTAVAPSSPVSAR